MSAGDNLIIQMQLGIIIARKIYLSDTAIGVFHFQNFKMMLFDQVDNRTDHFRLHHFQNHRAGWKFRTVTFMFDRITHDFFLIGSALTARTRINRG